jgi:hypothetical protein
MSLWSGQGVFLLARVFLCSLCIIAASHHASPVLDRSQAPAKYQTVKPTQYTGNPTGKSFDKLVHGAPCPMTFVWENKTSYGTRIAHFGCGSAALWFRVFGCGLSYAVVEKVSISVISENQR